MDSQNGTTPIKDLGSEVHMGAKIPSDADIKEHRSHGKVFVGLHLPKPHQHRYRRHRHHGSKHGDSTPSKPSTDVPTDVTSPAQRVQFLLGGGDDDDDDHKAHPVFCEMAELLSNDKGEMEWKETARWVKFEEDVEEGGERWSKPHVATLSLHALFELRHYLTRGTVILDMAANSLPNAIDVTLDSMVASKQLEGPLKDEVRDIILLPRHRHLYDITHKHDENGGSKHHLPSMHSFADTFKKRSEPHGLSNHGFQPESSSPPGEESSHHNADKTSSVIDMNAASTPKSGINHHSTAPSLTHSSSDVLQGDASRQNLNLHFMKKIPKEAEAANILVGEVDFLNHPIVGFIRLLNSQPMGHLTEVPVPTKFIFFLLGPIGNQHRFHEIGRSIATLMSDEVFHDVAYHAKGLEDLLAGMDEFMDQLTALPPGEWDPSIRIEPPPSVPSQTKRKQASEDQLELTGPVEEEVHGDDPCLQRTGRLFGGLIDDVKRKAPFYASDFKDVLHVQCLASFVFLYFACLTPIITFGGLLSDATDKNMAAFESILAGAICGIVYALCSGQPLTIIGSTGPILVFETIVYDFCIDMELEYLEMRFWIGMWTGIILIVMTAFDLSALVRYITRFTEESFALLISLIFIKEAIAKLIAITDKYPIDFHPDEFRPCNCHVSNNVTNTSDIDQVKTKYYFSNFTKNDCDDMNGSLVGGGCIDYAADVFFFSVILFIGTFTLSYGLKMMRNSSFFPSFVRTIISDFAVPIAIISMIGLDAGLGLGTPKLEVPDNFAPTKPGRGWFVNPVGKNPWWLLLASIIPALLATILIFMDQQITAVIVNRSENKLKKGKGYHLDLFVVAILIIICSILGLPWFVAATVLSINHVMSLKKESECTAPGEKPTFLGVREQRVTGLAIFFVIGMSVLITSVLKAVPMPVLYGVFMFMGVSSLRGMQVLDRVLLWLMPQKYQPDVMYLRHVRTIRVHIFTIIQVVCLIILWVVKSIKVISIAFPLMVLAMCFVRKGMDKVFTQTELKWLDDIMPESHKREKADAEKKKEEEKAEESKMIDPVAHDQPPSQGGNVYSITVNQSALDLEQVDISDETTKRNIWDKSVTNDSTSSVQLVGMKNSQISKTTDGDSNHL